MGLLWSPTPEPPGSLQCGRPSSNVEHIRSALNRPNSNARKELTGDRSAAGAPRPDRAPGTARAVLLLLLALALAPPAAALGGVMRFATAEVAFHGGFGGVAFDVWRVEPYGYLSQDAGVWAIQAGVAAPVVRRERVRVSLRLGTSTAIAGPAVEPNVHPTVGAGVRVGRRVGALAEVDRAQAFTLLRAGVFVGW